MSEQEHLCCERCVGGNSATLLISCDRPAGIILGGAEDDVVERGECHDDEIGAENACETGKDDMADR